MVDDNDIIEFADVRLDRRRAVLERNGSIVQVRPRTFALLCYLAENPNRVVSKDEILAAVWQRIAVSDDALTQTIKDVRRVIDDRDAAILRTIPKRGFLFADDTAKEPIPADALEVGQAAETEPAPETRPTAPEASPPEPKRRFLRAPVIVGIIALAFIAVGGWRFLGVNANAPSEVARLSIVVLPFANLSGDPNQDYFADGVTDNLTTDLSRIRNSFVIARNTAFTFKGKSIDAKGIGKELGVRYVLEGSVQRDQGRVRVNAQLIDAESGSHRWADRFEEDMADLFKLQDQVVARLANALNYELIRAEAETSAHSKNPDVIDLDMRGHEALWRFFQQPTREGILAIRALFEKALKIDPDDPDALGDDAVTYLDEYSFGWTNPETDYEAKILGQVDRAIALAPRVQWNYSTKSVYLTITGRPQEGLRVVDAEIAINPNYASPYTYRSTAEVELGQYEQAKSDVEQAMRLSPHDPRTAPWQDGLASAELGLGQFDAAIDDANKAIDAGYRVFWTYLHLAAAHALKGDIDEAKTALSEARRLKPNLSVKYLMTWNRLCPSCTGYAYLPSWFDTLRKAGLPEE
jgi:TolB-like protein/DNA-binding winged helix-turn-helix (wHTH) protein